MTKTEQRRIAQVIKDANTLMDAGPSDGRNVLNVDVIEALIGDLGKLLNNQPPTYVAELLNLPSS